MVFRLSCYKQVETQVYMRVLRRIANACRFGPNKTVYEVRLQLGVPSVDCFHREGNHAAKGHAVTASRRTITILAGLILLISFAYVITVTVLTL